MSGVLDRYPRGDAGEVVIEVAAERAEDLYDDFTKQAPYIRRDLDSQLADYLVDSAREIGPRHALEIRIVLELAPDPDKRARILKSIPNYFLYLADAERLKIRRTLRRSVGLFAVGFGLVILMVWVKLAVVKPVAPAQPSVIKEVLGEGLTIAAWVAMWEALGVFAAEWLPHRRDVRLFQRLAAAKLVLGGPGAAKPAAPDPERRAG